LLLKNIIFEDNLTKNVELMKLKLLIIVFFIPFILNAQKTKKPKLKTENDSISYALAISLAEKLKSEGVDKLNAEIFSKTFNEAIEGKKMYFDTKQVNDILENYFKKSKDMQAQKNLEEGEKFLEENKKKDGVITLESGLQYIIVKKGEGEHPKATDEVETHYHGTFINGKVFDSSYDRGKSISFPVGGVIAGWTEALMLMKPGSKWKLFIPSGLAYGTKGAGGVIGPNTALIFDVELISIKK